MPKHRNPRGPMRINGVPVVDAKRKLVLEITPKNVAQGNTKDPGSCAAARACTEMAGVEAARVHLGRTYVLKNGKWTRYTTPLSLRSEIVAFDRGGSFSPGKYILGKPVPSAQTGKRQGTAKGDDVIHRHRKRPYHITEGVRAHGANK